MTPEILQWLATTKDRWCPYPASILEIGSFNVNGSPRSVWQDCKDYVGVDISAGPGVDRVADSHGLWLHRKFDVVICCETLEHDTEPMATIECCRRHLAPGGLLIITSPANGFPDHKYPRDYWRLMPDAYSDLLFAGLSTLEVVHIAGPTLCGIAKNKGEASWHSQELFDFRMQGRRIRALTPLPLAAWYHVACMNNWREVFSEQTEGFSRVGIEPTACVLGTPEDVSFVKSFMPVAYSSSELHEYETPTLQKLWEWSCSNQCGSVLYAHTKGVSAPGDPGKAAWRALMSKYVVDEWRTNVDRLSIDDIVGVDWQDSPSYPHFSGNFWMARADWIAHLPSPTEYRKQGGPAFIGHPWERMHAEMWIGSRPYHHIESLCCRNENIWQGNRVFELLNDSRPSLL